MAYGVILKHLEVDKITWLRSWTHDSKVVGSIPMTVTLSKLLYFDCSRPLNEM
jgi:hypothetical protein